ncbi:glycosyltransferase family 2 protein [Legionella lytica]|uniref:Glycosyltransferase family 2 protein n=1 Tax=Legionella lytica TaxID=96232 RepID=A0ABW8DCA0_9GAMM
MHNQHVTILLATYNGETYLKEQLESIIQQTHKHWHIFASDDGSNDRTMTILKHYKIQINNGPREGFATNFLFLITKVGMNSDYYAFSDQDDIWDPNKLTRAIDWLNLVPEDTPALYCGRTHLINDKSISMGYSPLFLKKPAFKNALVQNIGGGNTMVFNRAALCLLRQTKKHYNVVSHDWWAYLLISGAGGEVYYDSQPNLHYRQHNANIVGSNSNWMARIYRVRRLFQGQLKQWIDLNNKVLFSVSHLLTPENKKILEQFQLARRSPVILRLIKLMQLGIFRQTLFGQLGLLIGTLFNKI